MKKVKVNGVEYISKEDYDELKRDYDVYKEEYTNLKKKLIDNKFEISMFDEVCVMGLGTVEIKKDYKFVKVSLDLLEKAIKIVKNVTYNKKRLEIVLGITKDQPLLIGDINKKVFSGVILAPRVED